MVTVTSQERFKTLSGVFDAFTNRNLFKLQSEGIFDELVSPIKVGKESNVFVAKTKKDGKEHFIIVKIYRIQNCDFKRMFDYIRKDPRYSYLMQKRREIIFAWTQREYKNLLRAERGNINSPEPLGWKWNILVEELIGDPSTGEPSLPLKDAHPKNKKKFFADIIDEMKKLYAAGLIHGDLSSFNILNHHEVPYFIDFSQATLTKTPNSEELLRRDIKNIVQFFNKLGVKEDEEKVFEKITEEEE
ncbi:serine protein kinase RIO [Candidatus Woesearchaeota archaeon]|nr:serine protein kinase RIO [Candidatus Woesearchaeota archaeon]